jgi:antitoxin YefM
MRVKNYSELRQNLTQTMDEVLLDHTPTLITRGSKSPVVIVSLDDFNALEETAYLLKSPANRKRLLASVENVNEGKFKTRELITT